MLTIQTSSRFGMIYNFVLHAALMFIVVVIIIHITPLISSHYDELLGSIPSGKQIAVNLSKIAIRNPLIAIIACMLIMVIDSAVWYVLERKYGLTIAYIWSFLNSTLLISAILVYLIAVSSI